MTAPAKQAIPAALPRAAWAAVNALLAEAIAARQAAQRAPPEAALACGERLAARLHPAPRATKWTE